MEVKPSLLFVHVRSTVINKYTERKLCIIQWLKLSSSHHRQALFNECYIKEVPYSPLCSAVTENREDQKEKCAFIRLNYLA